MLGCRLGLHCFEFSHESGGFLRGMNFTGLAKPKELDHVQAAFAQLQTANQAAFTVEFCGQLSLGQSRFGAEGEQGFANTFALTGINGFVHARMLRALFACFQNAGRQNYARDVDFGITNQT